MRRHLALFAAIFVVCFAAAGIAQTSCPAPTIVQIGGTNPSCAGQPVTLDAGDGWVTYQWSNGATTRVITDAPVSTTTYSVTVTDANGCSVTSTPLTVGVDTVHVPRIQSSFGPVCSGGTPMIYAYSDDPNFTTGWSTFDWSVTNGTITSGANTASPQVVAGQSGTMTFTLNVTEPNGCASTATYDLPIRAPEPPPISAPSSICFGVQASASVDTFCCSESLWTISGGTLEPDGVNGGPHTNRVFFTADGSGPVTLTYTGHDNYTCLVTNSVTIPLASVPPPVIRIMKSPACAAASNQAYAEAPAGVTFSAFQWSIQNGVIDAGATSQNVSFHGDGSGQPVVVTVLATEIGGCVAQASATIGIRTIAAPTIGVDGSTCPNATSYAYVYPPSNGGSWTSIVWSVTNGTLLNTDGQYLQYSADGSGPVTLSAVVTDSNGCSATATQTVELKTITPELNVQYSPSTATAGNNAWVTQGAGSVYTSYLWSIEHGTFDVPPTDSYATFHPDGSGTVRLTVTVMDSYGCSGTSSIDVPLATVPTPQIRINYGKACPAVTNYAWIPSAPDNQQWASVAWSITHGTIVGSANSTDVQFGADGTAPATLSVTVTDGSGASATASVTLPLVEGGPPIVSLRPTACSGGWSYAWIDSPPGTSYYGYYWSVTNAQMQSWPTDSTVSFIPNGSGPVTVSVSLRDSGGCPMTSSTVINLQTLATPEITTSDPMPLYGGSAQLLDPNEIYANATWSVTHGNVGSYGDFRYAAIYPDGSGPVTVTCVAQTFDGCPVSVSREVLLEGNSLMIDAADATLCGPVNRTASLFPSSGLTNIQWSITNGTILSGANDYNISFHADGAADVTLSATATAAGGGTISATKVIRYVPFTATISGSSYYCPQYYSQFYVSGSVVPAQIAVAQSQNATVSINGAYYFNAKAIDPSQPMSVTITATSPDGCQTTATVTQPSVDAVYGPVISVDRPSLCATAQAHATITNAQPNVSYSWQIVNGALDSDVYGSSVTFHATGSAPVTLRAFAWPYYAACSAVREVTIPVAAPATPVINLDTPEICADTTEFATTPSTGTLLWSASNGTIVGANNQSMVYFHAGSAGPVTLTLTVTDGPGCSATSSVVVPLRTPTVPAISLDNPNVCPGGGSFAATPLVHTTYAWSITGGTATGATNQPHFDFVAGPSGTVTLNLTVTDNGCVATNSATVNIVAVPTPTITASGPTTFCAGGEVTLTASAGSSYLWSNGATGQSITVLASGNYSVTVRDGDNCAATSAATAVTVNPLPDTTVTVTGSPILCDGGSVTLTAPSATSYLWSNGATTQSISVWQPASYSVTVTGSNGCSATSAPVVVSNDPTTVTISGGPAALCLGGSVHLASTVANGSALSYQWYGFGGQAITGATSPTLDITPTTGGYYFLRIADANGCTVQSNTFIFTVAEPAASITAGGPTTFCDGGSVTLTANSGASYLWSNGATTQSIEATTSGSYTVTVTDAGGCGATSSPTVVTVNATPSTPPISVSAVSLCPNGAPADAMTDVYAGYSWSIVNGAFDSPTDGQYVSFHATGNNAVELSVTVTGDGGCTAQRSVTVPIRTIAPPQIAVSVVALCPNGVSGDANVPDEYGSYSWSIVNGAFDGPSDRNFVSFHATSTAAVQLSITVNDGGCVATTAPVVIPVNPNPATPTITANEGTSFCEGGSITLTSSPAASYLWSNGERTQTITVTAAGTYSVTVFNEHDCGATSAPINVTVNPNPAVPTIGAGGPTTFCEGGSVTLTAPASDSYLWSTGATTQSINVTTSGSYSVTVTNASGCSAASAATTVTVNANPSMPVITPSGATTFCDGGSVTLTAPASASYLWSNGATTQSINVTTSGSYSVTVTNASGCSAASAATTVTVNANPSAPVITVGGATTFCDGGSVTLTAPASASYLWSNGATTQSINVTTSGSYSVTVTNASGCSATSAATAVTVNANPSTPVITPSGGTTFCAGGSVTLTAPASASYLWSNGATSQSINVTTSGQYSVTVTNGSGCTATSDATTVTVNANPTKPVINTSGSTTFCTGGSVTLTAPASSSYLWSTGATSQSINVTTSGQYSVTVTNGSGCTATSDATTVTVNANPTKPVINTSGSTTFCDGGSVTLTAPASSSYLWSNGATSQSINVTTTGQYSVIVTNASGCTATSDPTTVTVNANPSKPVINTSGSTTFCTGGSVTLTAPASSSYLWSTGATSQSINVTTTGQYSVIVTNGSGCTATSDPTTVTVNAKPATPVITAGGSTAICPGSSVTLTAPAGFTYLWSTGAQTQSINASSAGNYTVTVTNAAGCSAASAATAVMMKSSTSITQPANQAIARNTTTSFTVVAGGTNLTYQWYEGNAGVTTTPRGTSATQTVGPYTKKGSYPFWVRVTGDCGVVSSATITLTVN